MTASSSSPYRENYPQEPIVEWVVFYRKSSDVYFFCCYDKTILKAPTASDAVVEFHKLYPRASFTVHKWEKA